MESSNKLVALNVTSAIAESEKALTEYRNLSIDTPEQYENAARTLQEVKHNAEKLEEIEEKEKRPHLDELKRIRELYRPLRDMFTDGEEALKTALANYTAAMEAKRLKAQREAQAIADRERNRLLKQAAKAENAAQDGKAAALRETAEMIVAPVIATEAPKVEGVYTKKVYTAEVVDFDLLPRSFKTVDTAKLQRVVSQLKDTAEEVIKGIKVTVSTSVSSTSRQPN